MKLQDLKEMFEYDIKPPSGMPPRGGKDVQDVADKLQKDNPHIKQLTVGSNATLSHSEDPSHTDRVWRTAQELDGGTIWLKYIHDTPDLHGNPFLPVVIEIESGGIVTYQVERLRPLMTPDIIGNEKMMEAKLKQYFVHYDIAAWTVRANITRILTEAAQNHDYSNIKDENLKQALVAIHTLQQKHRKMELDFTSDNLMWRVLSTGPQLVIIDPVWL